MINLKEKISDYTESEFYDFVYLLYNNELTDKEEDRLIFHFDKVVKHPEGTDIIFYPTKCGIEDTPEAMVAEIKRYYVEQGLPCFKE